MVSVPAYAPNLQGLDEFVVFRCACHYRKPRPHTITLPEYLIEGTLKERCEVS